MNSRLCKVKGTIKVVRCTCRTKYVANKAISGHAHDCPFHSYWLKNNAKLKTVVVGED